jgi:hypothetical protein
MTKYLICMVSFHKQLSILNSKVKEHHILYTDPSNLDIYAIIWQFHWQFFVKRHYVAPAICNDKHVVNLHRASDCANAEVATVLGSIPASSNTEESERRQMKQCGIQYMGKNPKIPLVNIQNTAYILYYARKLLNVNDDNYTKMNKVWNTGIHIFFSRYFWHGTWQPGQSNCLRGSGNGNPRN